MATTSKWGIQYPDPSSPIDITNWSNLATSIEGALDSIPIGGSSSGYDISVCLAQVDASVSKVGTSYIAVPLEIITNLPDSKGNTPFSEYYSYGTIQIAPNTACIILGGLNFYSVVGDNNHFMAYIYMNPRGSSLRETVASINTFAGGYSNKSDNQFTVTFPPALLPATTENTLISVSASISNTQGCNISTSGSKILLIGLSKGA